MAPVGFRVENSLVLEHQGPRPSDTPLADAESWLASCPACPQLPVGRIQGAGDHSHQGLIADGTLEILALPPPPRGLIAFIQKMP